MVLAFLAMLHADFGRGADRGLVGFWKLQGDCLDHSGRGHHGKESDRAVLQGLFHGAGSHVEVPSSPDFDFGTKDFSIAAWVKTDTELNGEPGDLVTKFDPARRQGFHLTVHAGNPGYNAQSNVRHLFFGVDNGTVGGWTDCGRPGGKTHIEVVGLTAYNGGFFAGTIPRAELFRWESSRNWSSIRRLFDPPGFQPVPVGSSSPEVADWSRASSMAVFRGQLFVSTATCYRTHLTNPIPDEPRGRVFSYATGGTVSWDRDLTPGDWQHLSAVRRSGELRLYVNGRLRASSNAPPNAIDVSNNERLQIGFGPQSFFRGRIAHVRLYDRALQDDELSGLSRSRPATLE